MATTASAKNHSWPPAALKHAGPESSHALDRKCLLPAGPRRGLLASLWQRIRRLCLVWYWKCLLPAGCNDGPTRVRRQPAKQSEMRAWGSCVMKSAWLSQTEDSTPAGKVKFCLPAAVNWLRRYLRDHQVAYLRDASKALFFEACITRSLSCGSKNPCRFLSWLPSQVGRVACVAMFEVLYPTCKDCLLHCNGRSGYCDWCGSGEELLGVTLHRTRAITTGSMTWQEMFAAWRGLLLWTLQSARVRIPSESATSTGVWLGFAAVALTRSDWTVSVRVGMQQDFCRQVVGALLLKHETKPRSTLGAKVPTTGVCDVGVGELPDGKGGCKKPDTAPSTGFYMYKAWASINDNNHKTCKPFGQV